MRLVPFIFFVFVVASCNKVDDTVVPAYVTVAGFTLVTQSFQGSNSSAISELWLYDNGNILGVVDTPVSLPLLGTGVHTLSVFPGIKNNGIGTSRIRYPFYTSYDTTITVSAGSQYSLTPHFFYLPSANIDAKRNFESGNSFVAASSNTGTIELVSDPVIASSGVRCVRMKLPSGNSLLSYIDENNIALNAGDVAFMEMDYSCNNTFGVGMYVITDGNSSKVPVLYLTPTQATGDDFPTWNKIYMDLGMVASQFPSADGFRLYVECTSGEAMEPTLYFDDIKIVK